MRNQIIHGRGSVTGLLVKIGLLGLVNAVALFALFLLIDAGSITGVIVTVVATALIDWVYLSSHTLPLKYLVPGTLFLLAFQIYPVVFNGYIAFTNYGTGNLLTHQQAVNRLQGASQYVPEDAIRYQARVLTNDSDEVALLLSDDSGAQFLGTAAGLAPLEPADVTGEGMDLRVGEFAPIGLGEANDRQDEILGFTVPVEDGGGIQLQTFTVAARSVQDLVFDPATQTMTRQSDGTVFGPVEGNFTSANGEVLQPGWRVATGFDNFAAVLTSPAIRSEFFGVLVWTIVFATMSVLLTFVVGLALAMALDDQRVRGRKYYRALLIIPYALPSFMTALIWQGLLNEEFGFVNDVLNVSIPWLTSRDFGALLPRISTLMVNTWLGFPYMLLVCTGALQAIPSELTDAARVDGASGWNAFRRITLPLLLVTVGPLLIASFAFNFNNFNVIFLLTGGDPPIQGAATPVGYTDILISYAYRLAFAGGRGADYGLAAAVSVFIFMAVALISTISFRRTRVLEEIN